MSRNYCDCNGGAFTFRGSHSSWTWMTPPSRMCHMKVRWIRIGMYALLRVRFEVAKRAPEDRCGSESHVHWPAKLCDSGAPGGDAYQRRMNDGSYKNSLTFCKYVVNRLNLYSFSDNKQPVKEQDRIWGHCSQTKAPSKVFFRRLRLVL